ncbi:hypothetical protein J6590_073713 [Homalodisca vitripennis]|nr:hypothetical protein J6590_073713 [Homalodisca vitripennis]
MDAEFLCGPFGSWQYRLYSEASHQSVDTGSHFVAVLLELFLHCATFGVIKSTVMDSSSNSEDEGGLFTSSEILKEMGFSTSTTERATKRSHQSSSGNENHNLKKIKMTSAEEDIVTDSLCYLSTMEMELQDVSTTLNISDIVDTAVSSCSTTQHQLPDIRNNYFDVQKDTSIADSDSSFDDPNDLDYIPTSKPFIDWDFTDSLLS